MTFYANTKNKDCFRILETARMDFFHFLYRYDVTSDFKWVTKEFIRYGQFHDASHKEEKSKRQLEKSMLDAVKNVPRIPKPTLFLV